jgi:uncharacterized protein
MALVTLCSNRLDIARKMGDSLADRHFSYRLFPFTLRELTEQNYGDPDSNFKRLMKRGGFPEPFLAISDNFAPRWRHSHLAPTTYFSYILLP